MSKMTTITRSDMKTSLAAMGIATADVLIDLRSDFSTTREEDIRELVITLQRASEVVIAGCEHLTSSMHIIESLDLMSGLYIETGTMLNSAHWVLVTLQTSRNAGKERRLQILEQRMTELQRAVEDFEYAANRIIDRE